MANPTGVNNAELRQWPQYRERARLIGLGEPTGDKYVDLFLQDPQPAICRTVTGLYKDRNRRMYLEACLLTEADYGHISEVLEMDIEVIETYAKVYYDIHLEDRITKLNLLEKCDDPQEKNLKMWALTQGIQFIAWRLGHRIDISPIDIVQSLSADCYFKAKEAFYNASTANASKEAVKWVNHSITLSRLLRSWVSDSKEATKDIEIALREITGDTPDIDNLPDLDGYDEDNTMTIIDELPRNDSSD